MSLAGILLLWQMQGGAVPEMIATSGPIVRAVLVILLLFSLLSWAIIFQKWGSFRRARTQMRKFLRAFRKSQLPELNASTDSFRPCPLVEVFESGYEEFTRQYGPGASRNLEAVTRALKAEATAQVTLLERRLGWLATTAAACPFIGLFGTVVGVVFTLDQLGVGGGGTPVVVTGVAKALIATGYGLIVAILAVIFNNVYTNTVKRFNDDFLLLKLLFLSFVGSEAAHVGR